MKNKVLTLLTLAMMGFGGYIGYTTNYVNTTTANEVIIPRLVDVPRTKEFDLNINLNKNTVECSGTEQDVKVIIQRKDSIVYRNRVVTKEVIKPIRGLREIPPLREKRKNLSELYDLKANSNRIPH